MIKASDLYFSYSGAAPFVISDMSLEISDGEYVSVVGGNGSGKTTLLRLILGFLKPTRGEVASAAKRRAYVPQKSDYTSSGFPITVYEMLRSYGKLIKVRDKRAIDDALEAVGLFAYKNALVDRLSGGQAQKALLARALMGDPELLILDEPSTGIDSDSQKEIYRILKHLNRDHGITVISVEHNLEAAIANSTLIYHLHGGHGHICTPEQYVQEFMGDQPPSYLRGQ
jgi:zinc transport system ATP-binding protein